MAGALSKAWSEGWMDEFSNNHFLVKAIEGRLDKYLGSYHYTSICVTLYGVTKENFQQNFCLNFSQNIAGLIQFFGEDKIKTFFTDQLSAGKGNYDEAQFFRALSEISILRFWRQRSKSGDYEPKTNGKKNPEARFRCTNGVTVDIEVKTPGFHDFDGLKGIVLPLVLLNDKGRDDFSSYCSSHSINGIMPRIGKLKDFLNSAAEKFENVDHVTHMNILYINWTFSEIMESGFEEAFSLLAHPINGILEHKDIGLSIGVHEEVYEKITAVIVYTELVSSLMFGDFRQIFLSRMSDGGRRYGIIGMHNCNNLYEITGMNPYALQPTPIIVYLAKEPKHFDKLIQIIGENMLQSDVD